MSARDLGFASSWRMLTRDKGWIKPVLILTMVGWIPILGQIVLFGYGLEWARLTAWGVDSAPKQRGVDYGKVLESGGRAFLVTVTLGFVVALVLQVVFPGSLGLLISGFAGNGLLGSSATFSTGLAMSLLALAASLLMGSFLQAAALRATIYDSFSAGWRLDRLFQMIGRDLGGFFRAVLVTWIGGAIAGAYTFVVALVLSMVAVGGFAGAMAFVEISGAHMTGWHYLMDQLLTIGVGPVLLFIILALCLAFLGGVITTTMNLVAMNAMGQWFGRFDVGRWGISGDPLPEDGPHRNGDAAAVQ